MHAQKAFSLLETCIVLSIMAILAAISLPSLQQWVDHTHDEILQQQLLQAISFARQEAQLRKVSVILCPSIDHHTCTRDWSADYLVFIDENEEGKVSHLEQILMVNQSALHTGTLHWRGYPHYRDYLLFSPSHLMYTDNGTFWYCDASQPSPRWAITLNKVGNTKILSGKNIRDSHGKPLQCS